MKIYATYYCWTIIPANEVDWDNANSPIIEDEEQAVEGLWAISSTRNVPHIWGSDYIALMEHLVEYAWNHGERMVIYND